MTDVRSLLRSERASRRIEHPLASYSRSGALTCSACDLPIKADSLWDLHIKSVPHNRNVKLLASGQKSAATASAPQPTKRKRDAESDEEGDDEQRKRTKAEEGKGQVDGTSNASNDAPLLPANGAAKMSKPEPVVTTPRVNGKASDFIQTPKRSPPGPVPVKQPAQPPPAADIDEDEWAAFERDMATPPPAPTTNTNGLSSATIEAAPVSAEDLARQAREEQSAQRTRKEEELEAEKEEANRNLEEEFEEMEHLEDRVRKLREKREQLKRRKQAEEAKTEADSVTKPAEVSKEEEGEDSDESDDSDYEDDWNFGRA